MAEFEICEKKEQIETIDKTMKYIVSVSGDYMAALGFLEEHGVETRIDGDIVETFGMRILVELQELRASLELQLDDMKRRK